MYLLSGHALIAHMGVVSLVIWTYVGARLYGHIVTCVGRSAMLKSARVRV